ncbi:MAG: type II toxin-antitoxin system RelE/ParE family toxin [Leeuwenhoekiella sp.]
MLHNNVKDLPKIWEYTFEIWSEHQAIKYYVELISKCQEIAVNPELGKNYHGISDQLLGLKSNKHIIFYRLVSENRIEVIRILHKKMDLKNKLT